MKRLLGLLLVVAMVAAACGGDDDTGDATTTTSGATGTTQAATTTAAPTTTGGATGAAACTPGATDGDLDLYNWTEYIDPDLITAFEDETGVSVNETFYDSNEAMLPQVEAGGNDFDLIVPSDYMVSIMADEDLLVPINKDALSNLANLDSRFTGLPFDPDNQYSVAYQWGTTGIGYSYEVVPEDWEPSWDVFFDPAVAPDATGALTFLNDPREVMATALKYLGYSANTTSQAELDEAVELLQGIKDRITAFATDGYEDLLVEGEIVAAHGYSGDFFAAYDEASTDDYDAYEDFGYGIPKEGGVAWVDTMAIPITADAPCTAHTFIDFILDAENGAALTNWNFYASPNAAAEPFIDPEILEDDTIYPSADVLANLEFLRDTGIDFELQYQDAFDRVKG
jgi:spermidine/putrescine-binding protein